MTEQKLGNELKEIYENRPDGEAVAQVVLFAIKYASVIEGGKLDKKEIMKIAGVPETRTNEISLGIQLSNYVDIKDKAHARKKTDLLSPPTLKTEGWKFNREEANER